MTRSLAICLTVALAVAALQRPAAQVSMSPEQLYTAYASGDYRAVARALRTQSDYRAIRNDLQRLIGEWKSGRDADLTTVPGTKTWSPTRAGFVFEIASTIFPLEWTDSIHLLEEARDLVTARPDGLAQNRPDATDRFEVALYRGALSLLSNFPDDATHYLNSIDARVSALERLPGGADLVGRLVLARGMVAETATRPLATDSTLPIATGMPTVGHPSVVERRTNRHGELDLQQALLAFSDATHIPSVAAEADIRRGLVMHRMGDQRHALEALDRGMAVSRDPIVSYWGALFRGRVLEASGRPADARTSYEQAAVLVPTAQTPAVALAAILLAGNDRAGAEEWAAAARAGRGGASDPWWLYWLADRRSLNEIVAQIRGAR